MTRGSQRTETAGRGAARSDAAALGRELSAQRARLFAAIAGVGEQDLKRRPAEGGWSIAEVLAHLLATERLWAGRIELALKDAGARVEPREPAQREEEARAGRLAPVPQLVHGLLATQRDLERLLKQAARQQALDRWLVHGARGRVTVAEMLRDAVEHVREHAAQIEALRQGLVSGRAGD